MIEVDGSMGYGQLLRSLISLSALTLKPVKITNIRKGRPKPGLMPQHLMGVKVAGEFCNATIGGLELHSMEVEFAPKSFNITDKRIDIGTAGSIPLLLQSLTPILVFSEKPTNLEIVGGSAGLGSPTIEFVKYVNYPLLSKFGLPLPEVEVARQGFYPRGQGLVRIKFHPVKKLKSIDLTDPGKIMSIRGVSVAGSLPSHIAERQANSAKRILTDNGFGDVGIRVQTVTTASPGTSITLWAECENTVLGADRIGKMGFPAEKVGESVALDLVSSIGSKAALDKYMSDQILPFLALGDSESKITVEKITEHSIINIQAIERILPVKFEVKGNRGEFGEISVRGIGLENKNL